MDNEQIDRQAEVLIRECAEAHGWPLLTLGAVNFGSGGRAVTVEVTAEQFPHVELWCRSRHPNTGLWPVVLDDVDLLVEDSHSSPMSVMDPSMTRPDGRPVYTELPPLSIEQIAEQVKVTSPDEVIDKFRERGEFDLAQSRTPEYLQYHSDTWLLRPRDPGFWLPMTGRGINLADVASPLVPSERDALALFPARRCGDVLAVIGWYAVDSDTEIAEHVTLLNTLQDRYDIRLLGVAASWLDLMLPQGIADPDRAADLAAILIGYSATLGFDTTETWSIVASEIRRACYFRPFWS